MTSQILFTHNTLLDGFSNFLNNDKFFLGMKYASDPNWDSLDLYLSSYDPSMNFNIIMLCLMLSPLCLIALICLTQPLNLMDKQLTNISSSLTNRKSNNNTKLPMNIVCSEASAHGVWNYWSFVYNEKDPTGKDLNILFDRFSSTKETRFIDGVAYKGFLFRPSISIGQGSYSHFNFLGTVTRINLKNFSQLREKYYIYSGQPESNPPLPQIEDSLFIRQFYDKAHKNKEDSYISDYESLSENESSSK